MKRIKLLLLPFFSIIVVFSLGYGVAKALPYSPGQTLDPSCTPGSFNCVVLATSTSLQNLSIQAASGANSLFDVAASGGSVLLHVTPTGNVGINTTTPGRTLTVVGDEYVTGIRYDSSNLPGSAGMLLQTTGTGTQWVATSTLGITGGGSLSGGTSGKLALWTSANALSSGINLDNGTVAGINATSSTTSFLVQGTGTLNPFQVNTSTGTSLLTVLANGNVGIGVAVPSSLFSIGASNQFTVNSLGNVVLSSGTQIYMSGGAAGNPTLTTPGLNAGIYFPASNALGFVTNGNDRIRIDSSGNVGVGTTTPSQKLSIAGNMQLTGSLFDSTNASGTVGMLLQTTGTGVQWVATSTLGISGGGGVSGGTNGKVAIWTGASALSSGDLLDNLTVSGVNATSSTVNFLIQGTGSNNPFQVNSSAGAAYLKVYSDGGMSYATSTLDSPTTAAFAGQYYSAEYNNGSATPGTIDWSKSNSQAWTLSGSGTFAFTNYHPGGRYLLMLYQDGTGSRTVTWPAALHWSGGTAPTLTTTPGQMDIITFVCGLTNCYGGANLNYAP